MNFFLTLFLLFALIVSCYATCDCNAADQPCLDKCVITANNCVVKCQKDYAGEACEQACIAANWPSMSVSGTQNTFIPPPSRSASFISVSSSIPTFITRSSTAPSNSLEPTPNNNSTSGAGIPPSFCLASLVIAITAMFFYSL